MHNDDERCDALCWWDHLANGQKKQPAATTHTAETETTTWHDNRQSATEIVCVACGVVLLCGKNAVRENAASLKRGVWCACACVLFKLTRMRIDNPSTPSLLVLGMRVRREGFDEYPEFQFGYA